LIRASSGMSLPGYGGGDKIRALLEAGEVVIRKEAVRHYGADFLLALNSMQIGMAQLPGKIGSQVESASQPPVRKMAEGGLVGPESLKDFGSVKINVGGSQYPVIGREDVVSELKGALRREQLIRSNN